MSDKLTPSARQLAEKVSPNLVFGQVLIERQEVGFNVRHVKDREKGVGELRQITLTELSGLAQHTESGEFRPLKTAPNLALGWLFSARNEVELEDALAVLYPGAVADWCATGKSNESGVTGYRQFTGRQTGMYRVTQLLSDEDAADVIRACCNARFCIRRRMWTVENLAPDVPEQKSVIPCFEPCPLFLEFARKAARVLQEEKIQVLLAKSDLKLVIAALEKIEQGTGGREADFGSTENPRRRQLLLEKLRRLEKTEE